MEEHMSLTRVLQEHYSWTAGPAEDMDGLLLIACDCGAILGNAGSPDIPGRHVAHVEVYVRAWWNSPLRAIPAFLPDPALVDNVEGNDRIRRRDRAAAIAAATPEESPTMPTLTEQERELLWEAIERAFLDTTTWDRASEDAIEAAVERIVDARQRAQLRADAQATWARRSVSREVTDA